MVGRLYRLYRLYRLFLALAVALALPLGCSIYSPNFADCAVKCGAEDTCPAGTTCNDSFCRPVGFKGACTCDPGDSVTCGGGMGECVAGLRLCLDTRQWGPCLGEVKASAEVCDGKDNDCDGTIDEDPYDAPPCPLSTGVCLFAVQSCTDGGYTNTCDVSTYGGSYEAIERSCDNLDNDCDGVVDARQAIRLTTMVDKWAVAPVTDGFVLFTSEGGLTQLTAQYYDAELRPVGTAEKIDMGGEARRLIAGGSGDKAVVGWSRTDNVLGIAQWERSQPYVRLNTALVWTTPSWSVAMTPDAGAVGVFSQDGGILVHRWAGGGAPSSRSWLPLVTPTTTVSLVQLTSTGGVVSWDGEFFPPDGGSSSYVGGVQRLNGTRQVANSGYSDGVLVETPSGGLQQIDGYSNFISFFGINLDESGMNMCFDVWTAGSCSDVARATDHLRYKTEGAGLVGNDVVVGWLDYNYLTVGTSLPTVRQVRSRSISVDGGTVAEFAITSPQGTGLVAILYRPQSDPTSVYALLMCPP